MKNLIIDATKEKIFFSIITNTQSYNTSYINSRENLKEMIKQVILENRKKAVLLEKPQLQES